MDGTGVESDVCDFSARIREQNLFREPEHEKRNAAREFVGSQPAMFDLIGEERELQDRSGHEMREHGNETGKIDKIRHRLRFTAVDIDCVAERLKGIEADPEWQNDAKERVELRVLKAERLDEAVVALDPEVEVFEEPEGGEV